MFHVKQARSRWQKFREKALSRDRQVLSRTKPGGWSRMNNTEVLLLAICEYLEHEVIPASSSSSPKSEMVVAAIHDWKENLKNGN